MYDEILSVNKKFKASVNLSYDLYNEEKLGQYIPTTDLCDVIKSYIKSVLDNEDKATLLAGPYGKGKSYLMLVLTFLLSKRGNRALFKKISEKIKKVDTELYNLLNEIDEKNISLMPVIINNNNFEDINQNFMIALKNALREHNIDDVIPNTAYSECISLINKWETGSDENFSVLDLCLKKFSISLNELKNGLKNFDVDYYHKFEELFNCVSHGYSFNPLISNDIGQVYSDVCHKIHSYGYNGMLIIFDEFGAFLDNQQGDFTARLNKIQSFAEKCSSSEADSQMHFCCVIHKDIKLYCDKDNLFRNEFETISGRFKQRRFDRSLDENYQIICQAIEKKNGYKESAQNSKDTIFIESLTDSGIFNNKNQIEYICENGYPFNPISLFALIQVSEKVAQNERTLFTFISDTDVNSFNYFISNNDSGLLNVQVIYDYFENLIHNNNTYKNIYYKVESLRRLTMKNEEHDIFKVIAIMKLIDDEIKYPATIKNIALSLNVKYDYIESLVQSMVQRNLLKRNLNDNSIDFTVIADEQVNDLINSIIVQKISTESVSSLLDRFDKNIYFVSNEYNFNNNMVRYYRSIYLEASTLIQLNDLAPLFAGFECDGLLINLVNDIKVKNTQIREILDRCEHKNIIIRFSDKMISDYAIDKLRRIFAAQQLLNSKKEISESVKIALPVFVEDSTRELNSYLIQFYSKSKCYNAYNYKINNLRNCINNSFTKYFNKTVVFNNEQVNKNIVSAITAKARNTLIDDILNGITRDYGNTSQEATIYDSFKTSKENYGYIIDLIKDWICSSNGTKINATALVKKLISTPYGMRKGIIPLFIADAISKLSVTNVNGYDTVILYNETSELELSAINISKLVQNPQKYFICFAQISEQKILVTEKMMSMFECEISKSFSDNILGLVKKMKSKISNLAPIIIKSNDKENILNLSKKALDFKDIMLRHDLNNYEVLFDILPKTLSCDFTKLDVQIESLFDEYDDALGTLYDSCAKETAKILANGENIKTCYDIWYSLHKNSDNIVFENTEKKLFKAFKNIEYNNNDAINLLSYATVGSTLDDWNSKRKEQFFKSLYRMLDKVNSLELGTSIDKNDFEFEAEIKLSSLGKTLYSNLLESIDEYGDALSNEEKATILKKLMNDILN